jgi:hypothetical protein
MLPVHPWIAEKSRSERSYCVNFKFKKNVFKPYLLRSDWRVKTKNLKRMLSKARWARSVTAIHACNKLARGISD